MFDGLLQDLRYGVRALVARPGFSITALLTLALAIGANTLVFSLIDGIYLSPLPYRDDARLVDVENRYPGMGLDATGASIPDYLDRRAGVPALADSALYSNENFNLAIDGAPERVHGIRATPSLFSTLGVSTLLGRAFTDDEAQPGADRVVVLGDSMWRNHFNADPSIVGRDVRLNGENYHVIGVMPAGFMFPDRETELYVPFAFTVAQKADKERGYEFSTAIGRLAPGATLADVKAQSDLGDPSQSRSHRHHRWRRHALRDVHEVGGFHGERAYAAHAPDRRARADAGAAAARRGAGAADCVRQHREPSADAAFGAAEGAVGSHGARCEPATHRAPAADRGRAARGDRRNARHRRRGDRAESGRCLRPAARLGFARARPARACFHADGRRCGRPSVRACARTFRRTRASAAGAARIGTAFRRRTRRAQGAQHARRRADRAGHRAAGERGTPRPQFCQRRRRKPGLRQPRRA